MGDSNSLDPTIDDIELREWMQACSLSDHRATVNAVSMIQQVGAPFEFIPHDLMRSLWASLPEPLSKSTRPDFVLQGVARYLSSTRSPIAMLNVFDRDPKALHILLETLSLGPLAIETLSRDPEAFEIVRITQGRAIDRQRLIDEVMTEVCAISDDQQAAAALARHHRREVLRVAYGQFIRQIPTQESYHQLSTIAESILRTAFQKAWIDVVSKCGTPMHPSGRPARCGVLAFESLGANQQSYSVSLKLMFIAETEGRTTATRIIANTDFFERLAYTFLEWFHPATVTSNIYDIELIRPSLVAATRVGTHVVDLDEAYRYFDMSGRTWERQMFVKASPIAGDDTVCNYLLEQLQPWIYRRYVGDADVAGLGAIQRKLKRRLMSETSHRSDAADHHRSAEDIEQTVLFLQLLHGHEHREIRVANTFDAIKRLNQRHILRDSESAILLENYELFLRADAARALGEGSSLEVSPLSPNRTSIAEAVEVTKHVIRTRLDESFPEPSPTSEESDLILDPRPGSHWMHSILSRYRFQDMDQAYKHLMRMSEEEIRVLSTRRCRYFLSKIAPALLRSIASTPAPDSTLSNLARMTSSLGGKGVLWELLASNPPTMQLIVRLCACGSYLVDLLTGSPGMIDELIDSLLLDRLPRRDELDRIMSELTRNAEDIDRIVHEFKRSMHVRVGIRDVMGKESIVETHRALSDIAEVSLRTILQNEYTSLTELLGDPDLQTGDTEPRYAVFALEKLGGQEPNYHSNFSLFVLFDQDGPTRLSSTHPRAEKTTSRHFYEQWAQRFMRRVNRITPLGRLFDLDVRFGPLGKSGVLAMQLDQFSQYFLSGAASVSERQSLCKARPIAGSDAFCEDALQAIRNLIEVLPFTDDDKQRMMNARQELQQSASINNIKRGEGGTIDVELLVQLLQLQYSREHPSLAVQGTLEAIVQMEKCAVLPRDNARTLYDGYYFLREVESALRLMNTSARHDFPTEPQEMDKLAFLLGWNSGKELQDRVAEVRTNNRKMLEHYANSHL